METIIIKNKNWEHLRQQYDWVADMHGVPQDAIHHAEGDVATHTQMVLEALINSDKYQQATPLQQEILWTAALLHDVEKRATTLTEADGRITSHGHARRGELTARQILFCEIPVAFAVREEICALVRYHGLPLWILEKPDPLKALLQAATRVDMRLLYALAKADVLGRTCVDKNELLDRVEFFKAYCIEQNCWGECISSANNQAMFHYFNHENSSVDYVPFNDLGTEVVMLSGLPGMGKDHFIRRHYKDYPVISLDDIRRKHKLSPLDKSATGWVVQQAKEQARQYLRTQQPFVWNATNITKQMRGQLVELFTTYKACVKIIYIETSYQQWMQQNKKREYSLPQTVLNKMLHKLEVPLMWEAHEVIYSVDN